MHRRSLTPATSLLLPLTALALLPLVGGCGGDAPKRPPPFACGSSTSDAPGELVSSELPCDTNPQVSDQQFAQLTDDNARFAFALYQREKGNGNFVFSPYSISTALAMTYAGAGGTSATQIAHALRFTLPAAALHPAFDRLQLWLAAANSPQTELRVFDQFFAQAGFQFEKPYLDLLATNYQAGVRLLDFAAKPDRARSDINDWIFKATKNRIQDLLPSSSITALTRFVLVNAITFDGKWSQPFDPDKTQPDSFHRQDGSTKTVDMMSTVASVRQYLGVDFDALEIPYVGEQYALLLIVPHEGQFDRVDGAFDADALAKTVAGLKATEVMLQLPKFRFDTPLPLKEALQAEGMVDPFIDGTADFRGMRAANDLTIGEVVHKAYIAVGEEGTEAAAATGVPGNGTGAPASRPIVRIDRPFLFALRHVDTQAVLFLGRVVDP